MEKNKIEAIKAKAIEEHIPIIMDDTLGVVAKILEQAKPKRILEIGTAIGYSAIRFSKYLQKGGIIDTIERDEERAKEAVKNIPYLKKDEVRKFIIKRIRKYYKNLGFVVGCYDLLDGRLALQVWWG